MPVQRSYCYITQRAYARSSASLVLNPAIKPILSRLLLIFGLLILIWVSYPIIRFQFINSRQMSKQQFLIPGGSSLEQIQAYSLDLRNQDYTRASTWFPQVENPDFSTLTTDYFLAIPKLEIEQAHVILGGEDLSKSLIHYGGTVLPGRKGNGVIFGHSILPQFFNPKNYTAIFSTLHTLENGDQIIVEYDNITYQYQVIDMFEVSPKDISVLDQTYDNEYLTLITCTPPGTYLRRLIVKAKLVPYQSQI